VGVGHALGEYPDQADLAAAGQGVVGALQGTSAADLHHAIGAVA
jgi:hypothetical protein